MARAFGAIYRLLYCRTDNPQGKLYAYQPDALKKKVNSPAELEQLIEACFVEGSSFNVRLRELILRVARGD